VNTNQDGRQEPSATVERLKAACSLEAPHFDDELFEFLRHVTARTPSHHDSQSALQRCGSDIDSSKGAFLGYLRQGRRGPEEGLGRPAISLDKQVRLYRRSRFCESIDHAADCGMWADR